MGGIDLSLVALALFGTAFLAGALALQSLLLERNDVYRTLRTMRGIDIGVQQYRDRELAPTFAQRVLIPATRSLARLGRPLVPLSSAERIKRLLRFAGSPESWDTERVMATKIISGLALGISIPVMAALTGGTAFRSVALAVAFGAAGYYIPELALRQKGEQRQREMRRALPDNLDLLAISVEAGLAFDGALAHIARSGEGPLAQEFGRVMREMQLGKPRVEALRSLAERSNLPELKSFVLAIVQADVFGVSVGQVLKVQAREMRIRRRQLAEEKAQKIPVKIVFPLVFCIMPALFVVLLGPAAINIYKSLLGS